MGQGVPEKVWVVTDCRTVPRRVMGIKIPRSKLLEEGINVGRKENKVIVLEN